MKTNEILKLLVDKDFLDKIYHFSYHRCNTSFEAEDLCSDIILAVISAIHKQERIENFYAFVWTIARRVYADYCKNRNTERQVFSIENSDLILKSKEKEIEEFINEADEQEQIRKNGNIIEPKIIVIDKQNDMDFYHLSYDFNNDMGTVIEQIAAELSVFMRTHIPEHLMNEYQIYTQLIAGVRILAKAIEECINEYLLLEPENKVGAEGVLMIVER